MFCLKILIIILMSFDVKVGRVVVESNRNGSDIGSGLMWSDNSHQSHRLAVHIPRTSSNVSILLFFQLILFIGLLFKWQLSQCMDRLAAVAILSIEAPSFVAFLSFARGVGRLIEGKPHWFKAAIYAVYLSFELQLRLNWNNFSNN